MATPMSRKIIAIDPGQKGAIVLYRPDRHQLVAYEMPLTDKRLDFEKLMQILLSLPRDAHVCLERAAPHAMGAKHAFNYGSDFAKIEIALEILQFAVTYIEPAKWAKAMHQGIPSDLKPKAKSLRAVKRLFPKVVGQIPVTPRSKKMHDGIVDALLIAGYGLRTIKQ